MAANLGGLLFGYLLLAAQEKVTSCRAAPGDTEERGKIEYGTPL